MNVGQVLETHLGLGGEGRWLEDRQDVGAQAAIVEVRRLHQTDLQRDGRQKEDTDSLSDPDLLQLARNLSNGVPMRRLCSMVRVRKRSSTVELADLPLEMARRICLTAARVSAFERQ